MSESGMIGDKEVRMSRLDTHLWSVDVVKHISDNHNKFIEGWDVDNEEDAKALYSEKVKEITSEMANEWAIMKKTQKQHRDEMHRLLSCINDNLSSIATNDKKIKSIITYINRQSKNQESNRKDLIASWRYNEWGEEY
tara:strand:+ start:6449 stop:6862 length:414 start_codon:yes stop_codon:yes gene_type:complete